MSEDVNEDAAVEHGLAVDGGDEVGDLLERQRRNLLHYLKRESVKVEIKLRQKESIGKTFALKFRNKIH